MTRSIFLGHHVVEGHESQITSVADMTEIEFEQARVDIGVVALFVEADLFPHVEYAHEQYTRYVRDVEQMTSAEILATGRSRIGSAMRCNVMTLLSALCMHHEQVPLRARRRQLDKEIERLDSVAYDSSFAYRFCLRLRNYVLHQGVDLIRGNVRRFATDSGVMCTVALTVDRPEILDTTHFKDSWSTVRAEIEGLDADKIDLRPLLEEAVGTARILAGQARILLFPDIEASLSRLKALYDQAGPAAGFPGIFNISGAPDDAGDVDKLDIDRMYIEKWMLDAATDLLEAARG